MNSSIDQQFIEFVVKSLVNNPDDVQIERTIDEKGVLLELTVNPEDLGRVIGKRGATAQSLRTLLRALGTKNDARYNLKIVDNGEPRPQRDRDDDTPVSTASDDDQSQPAAADNSTTDDTDTEQTSSDVAANDEEADDELNLPDKVETDHDDVIRKTRAELDDLDDLDI